MSEQSLVLIRLCLLALVYLVFLRVLRAVWVELRAEQGLTLTRVGRVRATKRADAPSQARQRRAQGASELLLVEPPALAGRRFMLSAETTLGRAPGCGVQIDDVRVSKLHARLFLHEG
ncbi:MAG: FHA domain-containing protein [Acidimicrobiaceae bacterium]|nr:FHA domain-containing protein [Acidimicrobiaceae bacterium]